MKTTQRSRQFKIGLATVATGMFLAIAGFSVAPASAAEKVTICHATNAVTNPYRMITVDLSATHGPDHATHTGPVFDPAVNTDNSPAWGDIIPNVLNWDQEGQALHGASCQLPNEPPDPPVCEFDPDLDADDPGCVGPTDVCPDLAGVQTSTTECPLVTDVCPDLAGVQTSTTECPPPTDACPSLAGVQASLAECPTIVEGSTLTPTPSPTPVVTPVVQVEGAQVAAAELPRTGKSMLPLAELGLGLVLLGMGALIFARDEAITA